MGAETEAQEAIRRHGGRLVARRLRAHGVTTLFTLSGGRLFSLSRGVGGLAARRGARAPRGRGGGARRRPGAAAPDARVRRAARGARPRRDRHRRRRRLRLLPRPGDGHLRAGLLARSRAVRLPRLRARVRAAAKLGHPGRQVVLLLGGGGSASNGMEFDTLARHGVDVVAVMGNNGIWALEKHPMESCTGARSSPTCARHALRRDRARPRRHGELLERPEDLSPALVRAFEAGRPALVNVLTDRPWPTPRTSNLA